MPPPGAHVVYIEDPLARGIGVILEVDRNGRLIIEWDELEGSDYPYLTLSHADEVTTEAAYYRDDPHALSPRDFAELRNP